jgi:ABC-2 type transport system permease protein
VALAMSDAAAPGRTPRTADFVRLKLRLMRNSFRGQTGKLIGFFLGLLFGLPFAIFAAIGLAATGAASADVGYVVAVAAGAAVVLSWTLIPLLFFGVDETLDPARFALLPIRPRTLTRGMIAAAFIGVPALVTLLTTSGLVVAAAIRFGAVEAVAAAVGVVGGLTIGVVASRAVTSAFAALLRSRRVRDLAAVLLALLATSVGPIQWAAVAALESGTMAQAVRAADVIAWTPLGAPYVLPFDVAAHRWDLASARVAITLGTIALLLWWWSRTLESAMLDTSSGGSVRGARGRSTGAVGALVPAVMRFGGTGPFAAIMARESRFWWRDGRRRAALISILVASAVVPVAFSISTGQSRPDVTGGLSALGFTFAITMAGTMGGMLLGNQFGYDGSAYAAHLLSRVRGTTELRARAAAAAVVALPAQIAVVVAVALFANQVAYLPAGLGILAASFGAALASAALLSVLAAYPMPENANPFAMNSGAGSAKGLLSVVALVATLVFCAPMVIAAYLVGSSTGWSWALLAAGVGYGIGAAWLGTYIAGDRIDRRGPELLAAVTPTR